MATRDIVTRSRSNDCDSYSNENSQSVPITYQNDPIEKNPNIMVVTCSAQSEQSSCTPNSTSSAIPSPLVKDQASQRTTELLNMQRNPSYQNPPTFSSAAYQFQI